MATRGEAEEVLPRLFGSVRSVAPVRGAVTAMNGSRLQATCTPIRGALMATISSRRKKSVALALAAVLTLAGAGAAFAYWTSTGAGDGSATTGADVAFEITSETAVGTIATGSAEIGRASCRERVGQYVWISGVGVSLKKNNTKQPRSNNS